MSWGKIVSPGIQMWNLHLSLTYKQSVNVKYRVALYLVSSLYHISHFISYCQFLKSSFQILYNVSLFHFSLFFWWKLFIFPLENALLQNALVVTCLANIFMPQISDCAWLSNKKIHSVSIYLQYFLSLIICVVN